MLIESAPRDAPWAEVARQVFWSREVDLATWRAGILAGHRSYLPDSVKRMSTWNFVRFLGRRTFEEKWPEIRKALDPGLPDVARLDLAWSYAMTGTFNMRPESAFASLPGRRREILDAIVHHQGASIYEIAKIAQVPYRRAHDHVSALIAQGLVRKRMDARGPRPLARLYTFR